MTTKLRFLIAPLGLVALALGAGSAGATCMLPSAFAAAQARGATLHAPAGWSSPRAIGHPPGDGEAHDLAGFWKFTFTDTVGNVVDFGYVGMHEGGTETLNSYGRAPGSGDVCMGVWKRQGPRQYKVSHYAPLFDPDNVTFVGTVNLIEELALAADGQSFSGTLTTTGYDASGNILFQAAGLAAATRVTVNTPAP
jgi:hypothetical protein